MKPTVLLSLQVFYAICGVMLAFVAGRIAVDRTHPRRWGSAAFWALLATVFLFGKLLPSIVSGYLVVAMVILAALKQVAVPKVEPDSLPAVAEREGPAPVGLIGVRRNKPDADIGLHRPDRFAEAARLGNRLFWPALLVPVITLVGSRFIGRIHLGGFWLADETQATVVSLGLGALIALAVAIRVIGTRAVTPAREGARLVEIIGWSLILPQLLAALGGIFQRAGVGEVVAALTSRAFPTQYPLVAVAAYCIAMAVFTVCMGNAFAAFAVITGGIGLPLIVQQHHGNPAIMAAIGMLSGYCGTLMTPMAANFNIVPAMLLELPDKNAVIKAQLPIAFALLAANIAVMYVCVYRF
jgi:uncharacterized membrane protein